MPHRIKQARQERGMNQKQLSAASGLSRAVLSQYEHGSREPSSSSLEKIAAALDFPVEYIRGDDVQPPNSIRIAGADGELTQRTMTPEQLAAIQSILNQLPPCKD